MLVKSLLLLLTLLLTLPGALAMAEAPPSRPLFVAHRGESNRAPENTLAAFRLAWDRGINAIEVDVHLTRDGQVIICHDTDTFRVSAKKRKLVIRDSTADELRQLDVGAWKHADYAGEKMPLLSEVLAAMPEGKRILIEIKPSDLKAVAATIDVIKSSGRPIADVIIISFHFGVIVELKNLWPDGPKAHYLADFEQNIETMKWSPSADNLIAVAKACRADGLGVQHRPIVDKKFIDKVHAAGLTCHVWTVDDPIPARRYADWGIDSITTNRAWWMRDQLKQ